MTAPLSVILFGSVFTRTFIYQFYPEFQREANLPNRRGTPSHRVSEQSTVVAEDSVWLAPVGGSDDVRQPRGQTASAQTAPLVEEHVSQIQQRVGSGESQRRRFYVASHPRGAKVRFLVNRLLASNSRFSIYRCTAVCQCVFHHKRLRLSTLEPAL